MDRIPPIDRSKPLYRDDPVIAALSDEEVWAIARGIARLLEGYARRLGADGVTNDDIKTYGLNAAIEMAAERLARDATVQQDDAGPPPASPRKRRPNPSRLAKWEAAWQAEREAES